jgi:hypothetical protein
MLAASLHFVNITLHFPKLQGETERWPRLSEQIFRIA